MVKIVIPSRSLTSFQATCHACFGLTSPSSVSNSTCRSRPAQNRIGSTHFHAYGLQTNAFARRGWASSARPDDEGFREEAWPETTSTRSRSTRSKVRIPTPYEIFQMDSRAPYTKHIKSRYYRLVKRYHPDTCPQVGNSNGLNVKMAETTRMQRYRLIVAAHEILSDPVKRSAYDRYSIGWNDNDNPNNNNNQGPMWYPPSADNPHDPFDPQYGSYRWSPRPRAPPRSRWDDMPFRGPAWARGIFDEFSPRDKDDSPFGNATWEDWEVWRDEQRRREYQQKKRSHSQTQNQQGHGHGTPRDFFFFDDNRTRHPQIISNGGFLAIILAVVVVGASVQAFRIDDYKETYNKQLIEQSRAASVIWRQKQIESQQLSDRDARIMTFLRNRGMQEPDVASVYIEADAQSIQNRGQKLLPPSPPPPSAPSISSQLPPLPSSPSPLSRQLSPPPQPAPEMNQSHQSSKKDDG